MKSLIVALAIAAASTLGMAQCQGSRISVSQELHQAGATLVGTVEAATAVPDSDTRLDGIDYTVRVDRMIKGHAMPAGVLHIFSENSAQKFAMQTGKQYLLFVHAEEGTYQVDNCGNSGLLEAASINSVASLKTYAKM